MVGAARAGRRRRACATERRHFHRPSKTLATLTSMSAALPSHLHTTTRPPTQVSTDAWRCRATPTGIRASVLQAASLHGCHLANEEGKK